MYRIQNRPFVNNPVVHKTRVEIKDVFPDSEKKDVGTYLMNISKSVLLNVSSHFLSFASSNDTSHFLNTFFSPQNIDFVSLVYPKIKQLENSIGDKSALINPYSSLRLFHIVFSNNVEAEANSNILEIEKNIFKAYLILNEEQSIIENTAYNTTENLAETIKIPMQYFCQGYYYSDFTNYNLSDAFHAQLVKAFLLFKFLETNEETKYLSKQTLKHFNCANWLEYISRLVKILDIPINNTNDSFVNIILSNSADCDFIDKLILNDTTDFTTTDFITIRQQPFYKVSNGIYRTIFNQFAVDKIFKGFYFLMSFINNKVDESNRIKDLKGIWGKAFSEEYLLYKVLNGVYKNPRCERTGKQIEEKMKGGIDYYIRNSKNVLFFESKDILIPKEAKQSGDYEKIKGEFEKRLYYEIEKGKTKNGAVLQLVHNIKLFLKNNLEYDEDYYSYREINIYPIIVLHDHQYNTFGLNKLIDFWFQEEVLKMKNDGYFVHKIKPLVIVDIDTLINHKDFFTDKEPLHKMMDKYNLEVRIDFNIKLPTDKEIQDYFSKRIISFPQFVETYTRNNNLKKQPKILDELGKEFFPSTLGDKQQLMV